MILAAFILAVVALALSVVFAVRPPNPANYGYTPFVLVAIAVILITWPWK